jgi:hypothetical protein
MTQVCQITITADDDYERGCVGFDFEDVVKNCWGFMVPWFTSRHGVRSGHIALNDGEVQIEWRYTETETVGTE